DGSGRFRRVCRAVAGDHGMRSRARTQRGPLAMRTRLMQPFTSVLSDPMLRNGYALIASATVTQVLGVAYWIVAARTAPAAGGGRHPAPLFPMPFPGGGAGTNPMKTPGRVPPPTGMAGAPLLVCRCTPPPR